VGSKGESIVQGFIRAKLDSIYEDFEMLAREKGRLCECCTTYAGGNVLDYRIPLVQDYYLLRYFPAYLAEYQICYNSLLAANFLPPKLGVVSYGCGCGVDLWGLCFALEQVGRDPRDCVTYTGIDRVWWRHADVRGLGKARIHAPWDVTALSVLDGTCNVIAFPKSFDAKEIQDSKFHRLCEIIAKARFDQDRVVLLVSLTAQPCDEDRVRLQQVSDALQLHGFIERENIIPPYDGEQDVPIETDCPGFVYPRDMRKKVVEVPSLCGRATRQGEPCPKCGFHRQHKWHIEKTTYFHDVALCYERT
jgi:hypothetical protein